MLTPGHFLVGQPLNAIPEPVAVTKSITTRWKLMQQLIYQFWKRWSTDYLNQLQQRPKWRQQRANIQVGDVVLLKNEMLPPTMWAIGRIIEAYPGKDGLVRVVKIQTSTNVLQRPISKLCRLPLDQD